MTTSLSSARRLILLVTLLAGALSALASDELEVTIRSGTPWAALVIGPTAEGGCQSKSTDNFHAAQSNPAGANLKVNFLPSSDASCPNRIVLTARGHRTMVIEAPAFTSANNDVIKVKMERGERIQVQSWLLECADRRGQACAPSSEARPNFLAYDADDDVLYLRYALSEAAGIEVEYLGVKEVPASNRPNLPGGSSEICGALGATLQPGVNYQPDALNVYYADIPATAVRHCPAADLGNPALLADVIVLRAGRSPDALTHEVGHALGLDHPTESDMESRDERNFMIPFPRLNRCNFTFNQAYVIALNEKFKLLRNPAAPVSGKLRPPLCPAGAPICGAMAMLMGQYQNPCWQRTDRVVRDWIQCLHCDETLPPEVDSKDDDLSTLISHLENIARGRSRVMDRQRYLKISEGSYQRIGLAFPQLPKQEYVDFTRHDLEQTVRMRAAATLKIFCEAKRNSENVRKLAGESLQRILAPAATPDPLAEPLDPQTRAAACAGLGLIGQPCP